jgi:enterochelin esterase family protein
MRHSRTRLPALAAIGLLVSAGALGACAQISEGRPEPDGAAATIDAAIREVEAGRKTTPLISGPTASGDFIATFLARSPGGEVPRIVSDATGWGENAVDNTFDFSVGRMTRVGRTDWYSFEARIAPRARIEYFVVHGRDYRLDPHNPRQAQLRAGGPVSEFVTPGYQPPEEVPDASSVPAGKTVEVTVESRALGGSRRVIVYTPPGYRADGLYPLAVFQFGVSLVESDAGPRASADQAAAPAIEPDVAPRLLDQWIAQQVIQPIVALFVEPHRYGNQLDYEVRAEAVRAFFTRDLLAWAALRYGVTQNADERALLAVSAGAEAALDAALSSPRAFGRLGLLIPGRRVRPPSLDALVGPGSGRLQVAILAGRYDQANLPTAEKLRQALLDGGHAVDYILVAEGHTRATWRNHVRDVLASLFGTSNW